MGNNDSQNNIVGYAKGACANGKNHTFLSFHQSVPAGLLYALKEYFNAETNLDGDRKRVYSLIESNDPNVFERVVELCDQHGAWVTIEDDMAYADFKRAIEMDTLHQVF